ncbi:hypothetical protein ACFQL4_21255 [Halosimplex aquaticum]
MSDSPSLRGLLWNRDEGRPRAFWRLGLAALLLLVGGIGVVVASALVALAPSTAPPILAAVVTVTARTTQVAGFAAAILAAAWLIDRRRLVDLGLAARGTGGPIWRSGSRSASRSRRSCSRSNSPRGSCG